MEFFWFIGEAQVVVSSSGWWNLSLLLLALSLGHLAEPVAELPAQKADYWRVKAREKYEFYSFICWERGEVESMIKFQHEIGAHSRETFNL